jgi:hypothetical protein
MGGNICAWLVSFGMRGIFWPLVATLTLVLACLAFYKADKSSFTHDEAFTYLNYVHRPVAAIASFEDGFTNNHPLNTLLMKLSRDVLGKSEWALRLPNVLAGCFYLLFAALIARRFTSAWMALPTFLLLAFQPALFAFFSLARGYGLANALMLGSVYFFLLRTESGKAKHIILAILLAGLAVFANFALLWYLLSLLLAYSLVLGVRETPLMGWRALWHHFRPMLAALVPVVALLYLPMVQLMTKSVVDFGGTKGFWHDTVGSLVKETHCLPPKALLPIPVLEGMVWVGVGLMGSMALLFWSRKSVGVRTFAAISLLLGVVLASLVQHAVLGTPYAAGRFALFMIPLFVLGTCLALDAWVMRARFLVLLPWLIAGMFVLHFGRVYSPTFHPEWQYDSHTRGAMKVLDAKAAGEQKRMYASWMLVPSSNFYRITHKMEWLAPIERTELLPGFDYYFVLKADAGLLPPSDTIFGGKTGPWILAPRHWPTEDLVLP